MPRKRTGAYDVGYGKPPAHTRFQPGKSGNSKGRPKRSVLLKDVASRVFREKITLTEDGVRKRVLKVEVVLKQLQNQAMKGDLKAAHTLIRLMMMIEAVETGESVQEIPFTRADQETLARMLERQADPTKATTKGDDKHV